MAKYPSFTLHLDGIIWHQTLLCEMIAAALRTRFIPALFDDNSVIEEREKVTCGKI